MKKIAIMLIGCLGLLWFGAFLDSASSLNKKGNRLFNEKRYQSAVEEYHKAQVKNPSRPEILYNLGTALYKIDQFPESARQLSESLKNAQDKSLSAANWYNYGNVQYRLGQFDQAVDAYKKALDLNPKDKDAKHNLELLLKKKGQFDKKQQERNKENPKKDEPKTQQTQQNQSQSSGGSQNQSQGSQGQNQSRGSGQGDQDQPQSPKPDQQDQNQGSSDQQTPPERESESSDEKRSQNQPEQGERQDQQPQQGSEPQEAPALPSPDQTETPASAEQQGAEKNQRYYQGQMSQKDALRILDALRDSEKELQVLRRPHQKKEPESVPAMDW